MEKIFKEIEKSEGRNIVIKFSTASDYFQALNKISKDVRYPLYQGDFLPYSDSTDGVWSGLYSSRNSLRRNGRLLESKVNVANFLYSFARARVSSLGFVPKVRKEKKERKKKQKEIIEVKRFSL